MGRPVGSKNIPDTKLFRAALVRLVNRNPERLDELAANLWKMAQQRDLGAIREIADRLDGKPHTTSDVTVTRVNATQMSDDELANIAAGGGEDAVEAPIDPTQLN